jgi:hypothetical protein
VTSETTFSLKSIFLREMGRQRGDEGCISIISHMEYMKNILYIITFSIKLRAKDSENLSLKMEIIFFFFFAAAAAVGETGQKCWRIDGEQW